MIGDKDTGGVAKSSGSKRGASQNKIGGRGRGGRGGRGKGGGGGRGGRGVGGDEKEAGEEQFDGSDSVFDVLLHEQVRTLDRHHFDLICDRLLGAQGVVVFVFGRKVNSGAERSS